jgi:ATP-dependent helicase/DNAse subunit B
MVKDKFSAVWVSHSSIGDYLKCPRAYFLKNMYRDPKTNHKVSLMQPPLALGQAVHEVVESLSQLPTESRFTESLLTKYDRAWQKISGKMGGFATAEEEATFKARGAEMITRIMENPGPLTNRAIKIRQDLPYFWLSEEDNIILCGKIDWLEYLEETDSVNIIDFKTGKFDEDPDSLQLPIYLLLTQHCQTRAVTKASYWYLDRDNAPTEVALPNTEDATKRVMEAAKKIHLARKLEHFKCPQSGGCRVCRPYEAIVSGAATFVGVGGYSQDIYILKAPVV